MELLKEVDFWKMKISLSQYFAVLFCFCASSVFSQAGFNDLVFEDHLDEIHFIDYNLHRNPVEFIRDGYQGSLQNDSFVQLLYGNPIIQFKNGRFEDVNVTSSFNLQKPYKLDIELEPHRMLAFGAFDDPVESQLGVAPKLTIVVAKGLYGVFQWIVPLQNDFIYNPYTVSHRPGQIGMGYDWFINNRLAITGYFGTLSSNQYGAHLEFLARSKDSHWYFGGSYFYTANYGYYEQYYFRESLQTKSGYVQLAYRWHAYDLTFRVIGDYYMNRDLGATFEVLRQYGNTDVGFFAIAAQNGTNAGFFFRCPLWPKKFYSNKLLQVRLPNTFAEYYNVKSSGNMPRVRNFRSLFEEMLRFNPVYLNNQLKN